MYKYLCAQKKERDEQRIDMTYTRQRLLKLCSTLVLKRDASSQGAATRLIVTRTSQSLTIVSTSMICKDMSNQISKHCPKEKISYLFLDFNIYLCQLKVIKASECSYGTLLFVAQCYLSLRRYIYCVSNYNYIVSHFKLTSGQNFSRNLLIKLSSLLVRILSVPS